MTTVACREGLRPWRDASWWFRRRSLVRWAGGAGVTLDPWGDSLKLLDLVPPVLYPAPPGSPEDDVAFGLFTARLTRQLGLVGAVLMLVATVGWWPLDAVVLRAEADVAAFSRLRQHGVAVELLSLIVLARMPARPPWLQGVAIALYALLLFVFGEALGGAALAPAGHGGLLWLADAWLGVVPLAILPLPLAGRVIGVAVVGGALAAGFFAAHPGNLELPGAWSQLSFGVFAAAFTVAAGETSYRVTRRAFFERKALDRARAALEALTDTLSEQVAERTDALRQLTRHLDTAQEAERRRLAHDLHDDLGQQLTAMRYTLARLGRRMEADRGTMDLVADLEALLDGTTRATRGVVTRLRPRILDDLGLVPAVEWLCEDVAERSGVPCVLQVEADADLDRLTSAGQLALFRVAQEATTNALRHASPARILVRLAVTEQGVLLEVRDDGRGFDPRAGTEGFGLLGLRERLHALGGTLLLDSAPGQGTTLRANLPFQEASP
jgi:signal transduction histidine kinase